MMTTTTKPVKVVLGGTRLGNHDPFSTDHDLHAVLDMLRAHHVTTIDTAQSYGESEATLGRIQAGNASTIDTKWSPPTFQQPAPAWATKDFIITSARESIERLSARQVDVFYLHRPDPLTPIAETLAAVNQVYQQGLFRRLGLSGFPLKEIHAVYAHCRDHGYPLPEVYQGSYNPLNRYKEKLLLPALRDLGMSFYAYGPSAGGFLGKSPEQAEEMANDLTRVSATCRPYVQDPKSIEALATWNQVARDEGVGAAEMAYRWMAYHSALKVDCGDAVVIGASSLEQLEDTLVGMAKGPLGEKTCLAIDQIWETLR